MWIGFLLDRLPGKSYIRTLSPAVLVRAHIATVTATFVGVDYGPRSSWESPRVPAFQPFRGVRPIPPRHPEAPDDHRSRGGEAPGPPGPLGRRGGGRAAGHGQSPVRDLLREEVSGSRARSL